ISGALYKFGVRVEQDAKKLAPVNEGLLKSSIEREGTALTQSILVRANYAAFVEFGTRKFAAEYVNTLPLEWQQLAERAKG
ncbi:HK97 gp10 family phage protein, partial [Enterococcus faecium]|uniref:HK97 gp10 family phage protein n=1 Tax=Enterococcus faecium TaxID=1352 RepID=UPI003DA07B1D